MDFLTRQITQFISTYGLNKKYWIAYSGGLDSHVLLHLFSRHSIELKAVHVNHGISPHAKKWSEHCARICAELNVDLTQQQLMINPTLNIEDQLRQARYQLFEKLLATDAILLTAHHQNDQAETVLLQLCRGAGPQGLAAMPLIKRLGEGIHARPLLDFTREDLHSYAMHHQLNWIEDESNANQHFTRNFLRHEVMPLLIKRWPTLPKILTRTAKHCASAQQWIDQTAQHYLDQVKGVLPGTLSVKKLLLLGQIDQQYVLRAWIEQAHFLLPSTIKMQQILRNVLQAREDKMPLLFWNNVEIRRYRDDLFLLSRLNQHDVNQVVRWDMSQPLALSQIGTLQALSTLGKGLRVDVEHVTIRFRKGGETLRLPRRNHHHALKKVFQMWGVLPWLRDRIPLVYVDGVLAAVVGYWIAEEFVAGEGEMGLDIVLNKKL